MSGEAFFDTNVLVYATVENDPKGARATAILAGGGVVSVQVLNEFAHVASRKLKWPWRDIVQMLDSYRVLCPNPLSIGVMTHEFALRVAARYGYSFYDSSIVASALEARCATLFSEDMQDGQVIGGSLTIRNPFLGS